MTSSDTFASVRAERAPGGNSVGAMTDQSLGGRLLR
jgi:hypothetical protein